MNYIDDMRHTPGCVLKRGHGGNCRTSEGERHVQQIRDHGLTVEPLHRPSLPPEVAANQLQLSQPELVEGLADLLEDALHSPLCYIDPEETHCRCLVGRIKALLPLCEATTDNGNGIKWRCIRPIHPSTPDWHEFGRV